MTEHGVMGKCSHVMKLQLSYNGTSQSVLFRVHYSIFPTITILYEHINEWHFVDIFFRAACHATENPQSPPCWRIPCVEIVDFIISHELIYFKQITGLKNLTLGEKKKTLMTSPTLNAVVAFSGNINTAAANYTNYLLSFSS